MSWCVTALRTELRKKLVSWNCKHVQQKYNLREKNWIFGQQTLCFCEVMALSKFNFQFIGDMQLFQVCFQWAKCPGSDLISSCIYFGLDNFPEFKVFWTACFRLVKEIVDRLCKIMHNNYLFQCFLFSWNYSSMWHNPVLIYSRCFLAFKLPNQCLLGDSLTRSPVRCCRPTVFSSLTAPASYSAAMICSEHFNKNIILAKQHHTSKTTRPTSGAIKPKHSNKQNQIKSASSLHRPQRWKPDAPTLLKNPEAAPEFFLWQ